VIEWKYVLFNWNDHPAHVRQATEMAKAAKVDILSFWPTSNPFYGISWRYRLGGFKNVGVACWKGREIILRPVNQAPHLDQPAEAQPANQ
jgi:hypothetical protein